MGRFDAFRAMSGRRPCAGRKRERRGKRRRGPEATAIRSGSSAGVEGAGLRGVLKEGEPKDESAAKASCGRAFVWLRFEIAREEDAGGGRACRGRRWGRLGRFTLCGPFGRIRPGRQYPHGTKSGRPIPDVLGGGLLGRRRAGRRLHVRQSYGGLQQLLCKRPD